MKKDFTCPIVRIFFSFFALALLVLISCGGGGGGGGDSIPPPSLTQEQIDAIGGAVNSHIDKLNDTLNSYCRDNPLSASCYGSTNNYIGFTESDFSGKTIYHVELNTYSKAEYIAGGRLKAYYPNQDSLYEEGIWSIYYGKLFVARAATPSTQTTYTMISDDQVNRYFKTSQQWSNGTLHTIGMFYDQTTGSSQAQDFVVNHRTP